MVILLFNDDYITGMMADEKRYAAITKGSVKLASEAAGVESLPDDVAVVLAEDVGYRLREATQASAQFMKHAKRKRLSSEDFNKALRWSDTEHAQVCDYLALRRQTACFRNIDNHDNHDNPVKLHCFCLIREADKSMSSY